MAPPGRRDPFPSWKNTGEDLFGGCHQNRGSGGLAGSAGVPDWRTARAMVVERPLGARAPASAFAAIRTRMASPAPLVALWALWGAEGSLPPRLRSLQEGRQFEGVGIGITAARRRLALEVGQPPVASRQPPATCRRDRRCACGGAKLIAHRWPAAATPVHGWATGRLYGAVVPGRVCPCEGVQALSDGCMREGS